MDNKLVEIRMSITKGIVVFVLSLILFARVDINFRIYAIAVIALSLLVPLNFGKNMNNIYAKIVIIVTSNIGAYGIVFHIMRRDLYNITGIDIFLNVAVILIPMLSFYMWCIERGSNNAVSHCEYELFPDQRYDLERIEHFVCSFEITGINGAWGSGKTFLVKRFIENNKDKYTFIRVDLLSCNLDEIQSLLIDEMEKILLTNRIYPRYSRKLKQMISKSHDFVKVPNILTDDESTFATSLDKFKDQLKLVGKPVVIVYEDIDRITNEDVIKKIFSISEQLASDWIKIVYQYDQANLDVIGLNRTFTEKYIPYVMNVTELDFRALLLLVYDTYKIDGSVIDKKDFDKLLYEIDQRKIGGFDFETPRYAIDLPFTNITIRIVKNFLLELQSVLKSENNIEYRKTGNKDTVLAFFFAKHFLYDIYSQFCMGKSVIETFLFEYKGDSFTIIELYTLRDLGEIRDVDVQKIFLDVRNIQSYWVICNLFGYNPHAKYASFPLNYEESANEHITAIHIRDKNDKKDRLIWNLLCNGTSEYTDYENLKNRMVAEVLSRSSYEEQSTAFKLLCKNMVGDRAGKSGNTNVQKTGGVRFNVELFRAFSLTSTTSNDWHNLLSFYFRYENISQINQNLIEVLNYCDINSISVFIDVLKRYNNLDIIGNLNQHKSYNAFLYNYISACTRLGFFYTHSVERLQDIDRAKNKDELEGVLQDILRNVDDLGNIGIDVIDIDITEIKTFLNKNLEIMSHDNSIKVAPRGLKINFRSHQTDEFKRLMAYPRNDMKAFETEIVNSYKNGKITVHEILQIQGSESIDTKQLD